MEDIFSFIYRYESKGEKFIIFKIFFEIEGLILKEGN